ncbi:hypothetical protein SRHO_G00295980 [Serrasalmus rhombeus]
MRIRQTGVDPSCHHTTAPTALRVTGNSQPAAIVLLAMRKTSHQSSSSAFQQAFSHLSESSQKHQDQAASSRPCLIPSSRTEKMFTVSRRGTEEEGRPCNAPSQRGLAPSGHLVKP